MVKCSVYAMRDGELRRRVVFGDVNADHMTSATRECRTARTPPCWSPSRIADVVAVPMRNSTPPSMGAEAAADTGAGTRSGHVPTRVC
jgi:hypothetical protein